MIITTLFFRTVTHFALLGLATINTTTAVPVEVEIIQHSSNSSTNSSTNSNSTGTHHPLHVARGMNLRKECRNYVNTVDRSSGASPLWRDCVQIYKKADANNGDFWMFMNKANEGENTLVKHGTCAFGVHVHKGHGPLGSLGLVGYQDILEVLMATERMAAATWAANDNRLEKGKFESLDGKQITRRLRDDARVQSKGDMDCHHWMLHDETFWVEWGLYRS